MEVVVAMAVIALVATGIFVGEEGQLRQVARSFDELTLSREAASRLERMTAPGASGWEGKGAGGRGTARLLEPGLYEVTVEARRGDHVVRLVTLVAREVER
jgi:hypothetical protein